MRAKKRETKAGREMDRRRSPRPERRAGQLTIASERPNVALRYLALRFGEWRTSLMPGKKTMWLTVLTFATASAFAAGNGPRARQAGATAATPAGTFDRHGDVGTVLHPGSVEYDSAKRSYTIAGSGENMWLGSDAFQFAWKKLSGDVTLTADITFLGKGVN